MLAADQSNAKFLSRDSVNRGPPPALGRRVCETKCKKGCSLYRKPFIHRVYSAQRASLLRDVMKMMGQGSEIRVPVPGPPEIYMGEKSPVQISLLVFKENHTDQGDPKHFL